MVSIPLLKEVRVTLKLWLRGEASDADAAAAVDKLKGKVPSVTVGHPPTCLCIPRHPLRFASAWGLSCPTATLRSKT